jgi:hypothetical protein
MNLAGRTGHVFRQISPERAAGRVVVFQRQGKGLTNGAVQIACIEPVVLPPKLPAGPFQIRLIFSE